MQTFLKEKNSELELYRDYLLSKFGPETATVLLVMVQGDVSHDLITRFLLRQAHTSRIKSGQW